MSATRSVAVQRIHGAARSDDHDTVVIEAPLELRARGTGVATIMRTPGHDLELVRGLLHAEAITAGELVQLEDNVVECGADPTAFTGRGLLATAACGVCGRAAIADLEVKAKPVDADTLVSARVIATLPDALRAAQAVFAETGGLHGAGLARADGTLLAAREDVGRHNAVDKVVGWAIETGARADVLCLSGRAGYELIQKAIRLGVPVVAAVSAPSSLAIELAERFNVALVGFVRGARANVYSHAWRISS